MIWHNAGKPLTSEAVHRFEIESGRELPSAARWFLTRECNGGWPGGDYYLPTEDPDNEYENLHGVYGIDHPIHNLLSAVQSWPDFRKNMWPIGYDDFGGEFVLMLSGPMKGQIRFMPYERFVDPDSDEHFLIAKDVQAFSEMLKNPSLPEIEDED
jgi:hypothetical protein